MLDLPANVDVRGGDPTAPASPVGCEDVLDDLRFCEAVETEACHQSPAAGPADGGMQRTGRFAKHQYLFLIGAGAVKDCRATLPQDLHVENQRPILHIT